MHDLNLALEIFSTYIAGRRPILIPLRPEPWATKSECFFNVMRMTTKCGGRCELGWQFQHKPFGNKPGILAAVHHGIWLSPDGEKIDITPPVRNMLVRGDKIWFLSDPRATLEKVCGGVEIPRATRVMAVTNNAGVREYARRLRQTALDDRNRLRVDIILRLGSGGRRSSESFSAPSPPPSLSPVQSHAGKQSCHAACQNHGTVP